ncbi:hypothetical protein PR002_g29650 [Phytophthora rubi]|uniref:RxLR effector protein n=1 Tax=Phytophthora rubi TaxID=129364 RepID=A0A6A3GYU7_9STRA|nr:hypothetical protein PR002_g29650 [Phytophthora rubi]
MLLAACLVLTALDARLLLLLVLQNPAGPSVEPPPDAAAPVSTSVQASPAPAPAPAASRASEAMQPASGSASGTSIPHVQSSSSVRHLS